jgi:cytochrome c
MEIAHRFGTSPFELEASIGESMDYDGDDLTATWLLDGEKIGEGKSITATITSKGIKTLTMELSDGMDNVVTEDARIIVGNSLPEVVINVEGNRSFYFPGEELAYNVQVVDAEDGTVGAGIDPSAITVSLDFLEGEDLVEVEYGHQMATEETQFVIGKRLIGKSDCAGCHTINEMNIGPSYLDVAKKYRAQTDAVAYLSGKIIKGGGGVWGEQAMSAHPDLTSSQAEQMANYILSLAGPLPHGKGSLPLAGNQKLNKHKAGQSGRYYLQATYTDKGASDGLPRLTSRESVVLRAPVQSGYHMDNGDKVMPFVVSAEQNPLSDEEMEVLIANNNGWAGYGKIDLTNITNIHATIMLAPNITSGGNFEIVTGNPKTGEVIGAYQLEQGLTTYGENKVDIPIKPTGSGAQPFYFRFTADSDDAAAMVGILKEFEFQRAVKATKK